MIEPAELQNLLGAWWFNYDEGNFDVLRELLAEDVHFSVRTDTDRVAWAEFARGEARGRDGPSDSSMSRPRVDGGKSRPAPRDRQTGVLRRRCARAPGHR